MNKAKKLKKYIIRTIILIILFVLYLYVANICLMPKSIILLQGEELKLAALWGIGLKQNSSKNIRVYSDNVDSIVETASTLNDNKIEQVGKVQMDVSVFDLVNVSNITINVIPKTKVIPLGNAIGLKLYTKGVLVVGMGQIEGEKPYENSGIEEGDRIVSINDKNISNTKDLIETVNGMQGKEVELKFISNNNEEKTVNIQPAKTKDNEYKLGLWVRDAAAGVGTATFYEPETNMFASLGHGITDIDTGGLITIANGELVNSHIVSVVKGQKGNPRRNKR